MTGTTFDERAEALARANGFSWPLREEELRIAQIQFFADDKKVSETLLGDNTRKSRMFMQTLLGERAQKIGQTAFNCVEGRQQTEEFFGLELCAEAEKHPFILGMLRGERATVWLKVGEQS
jgi:hypothetical protein